MRWTCPVCGYPDMTEPPKDYYICPSCGTEFGNDDTLFTYDELREHWLENGARWFSRITSPPVGWDAYKQLFNAGLGYETTAPTDESKIAVVDLGARVITVVATDGSFTAEIRERVVALGRSFPSLLASINPVRA